MYFSAKVVCLKNKKKEGKSRDVARYTKNQIFGDRRLCQDSKREPIA